MKSDTELDVLISSKQFFGLLSQFWIQYSLLYCIFELKSIKLKQIYHTFLNLNTKNVIWAQETVF